MSENYEYKGYIIRYRQLATGDQWQVVEDRKILSRHDAERQARKWVRETLSEFAK